MYLKLKFNKISKKSVILDGIEDTNTCQIRHVQKIWFRSCWVHNRRKPTENISRININRTLCGQLNLSKLSF